MMRAHQANQHDGLAQELPCQLRQTEGGLQLVEGKFFIVLSLFSN
jgi:hypothetical protein